MEAIKVTADGWIEVKNARYQAKFHRDDLEDLRSMLTWAVTRPPTEDALPTRKTSRESGKLNKLQGAVYKALAKSQTVKQLCALKDVRASISSDDEERIRATVAATITRLHTKGLVSNKGDEYLAVKE